MKKLLFLVAFSLTGFFLVSQAQAAVLNLNADSSTYPAGQEFTASIKIDSEADSINGAQATIQFDNTILEVKKVDRSSSIFNFWLTEPTFDNGKGTVDFIGASTSGYTGKSLNVLNITFKAKGAGQTTISFNNAAVTAADGSGRNVLSKTNGVAVSFSQPSGVNVPPSPTPTPAPAPAKTVAPPVQIKRPPAPAESIPKAPVISVTLYDNSEKWSNISAKFFASWKLPADVTDVATLLDKVSNSIPAKSEGLFESKEFLPPGEGISYLHVRFKNKIGWGAATHYAIMVDTAPPAPFAIQSSHGFKTDVPDPTFNYAASDSLSGIDSYSVQVDSNDPAVTHMEYFKIPRQKPGDHSIRITAYDKAGNATQETASIEILTIEEPFFVIGGIKVSELVFFAVIIALMFLMFAAGYLYENAKSRQRERKAIIAVRDVNTFFDVIKKDADAIQKIYGSGGAPDEAQLSEIGHFLMRINENLQKMRRYMTENIEEIK